VNNPAFVEPMPGTKPLKNIKIRDVNTDKLEKKAVKGTADSANRTGLNDSQAISSSGKSACEPLNKTRLMKKKASGRCGFVVPIMIISRHTVPNHTFLIHFGSI